MKTIFTFVFSMVIVIASVQGQLGKGKSVIKYLGTTFLMNDGCPAPKCDASRSECQRIRQMVRALYSHCLQSQVATFFSFFTFLIDTLNFCHLCSYHNDRISKILFIGWTTCWMRYGQDWRWKLFDNSCLRYDVFCNVLRNKSKVFEANSTMPPFRRENP